MAVLMDSSLAGYLVDYWVAWRAATMAPSLGGWLASSWVAWRAAYLVYLMAAGLVGWSDEPAETATAALMVECLAAHWAMQTAEMMDYYPAALSAASMVARMETSSAARSAMS